MIPEFHLKSHFVHPFYKEKLGILLFLFVLANHMTSAQNNIRIGFLGIEPLQECTGERLAAFQSLRQSGNSEANYIQIQESEETDSTSRCFVVSPT
ncbi:MAG: hypothetical protein IPH45_17500 [Bacteroidales bacterium]|nr:hypothetical protein [Bacteroidales bacterium]